MDNSQGAVGVMYGNISSTHFQLAVSDPSLRRLDYVQTEHPEGTILCQVETIHRRSDLSFDQALSGASAPPQDRLSAEVHVLGYKDGRGRVQVPRTPFSAGAVVLRAEPALVMDVLGLGQVQGKGAYIGHVKGLKIPVHLSLNMLAQKHLSVLAKTGAGKSYTVGVILEEFLQAGVPLLILDPHGEYGALRHPNVDEEELGAMVRFKVRPKSFQDKVREFAVDTALNPEAEKLRLDGVNLEAREVLDLLGGKLSGGQVGVLYQAVKDVKEHMPGYTLRDVMDAVAANKSSARWNVLNALEALDATGLFHTRATPMEDLLRPGQCTIINLKGVPPDQQEIVATRLIGRLWEARKRNEAPPHILVVEEAHNFCPERGVAQVQSGAIIRTVASEGRKFGMGLVIVSQRPAKIDKNVLSQCNTQVVLKITNPNDLKAISQSVEGITAQTTEELQRLPVGSALVSGGGLTQPVFVDIRPRLTAHGGRSIDLLADDEVEDPEDGSALAGPVFAAPGVAGPAADAGPERSERAGEEQGGGFRNEADGSRAPATETEDPWSDAGEPWQDLENVEEVPPEAAAPRPRTASTHPADPLDFLLDRDVDPDRGAPDHQVTARSAPARQEAEKPPPPRDWKQRELQGVKRVVERLEFLQGEEPDRVRSILEDLALRQGRDRDHYLRFYHDIAVTACHADTPACVRCPLSERCPYNARLRAKRHKDRTGIRRLWLRR